MINGSWLLDRRDGPRRPLRCRSVSDRGAREGDESAPSITTDGCGFDAVREYARMHEELLTDRDDFGWATISHFFEKDAEIMALADEAVRSGICEVVVLLVRAGVLTVEAMKKVERWDFTRESSSPPNY